MRSKITLNYCFAFMDIFLRKQKSAFLKILVSVAVFFIFIFILNFFQSSIKNFFYYVSSPAQKVLWHAGNSTAGFLIPFLNSKNLEKENAELKTENQKLLSQISFLQNLRTENQALRDVISREAPKDMTLLLADVSGLDSEQDFILINKGSDDGVKKDMPVISQQKVLFGKVFEVFKNFSRVILISDKNNVIDIKVRPAGLEAQPVYGALKGSGRLSGYLDLIPLNSEIKENDVLVTSALDGVYPKDLLVAKIAKINENDLKPFLTAVVELFFDIKNLDKLFVVMDYKQEK